MEKVWRDQISPEELGQRFFTHINKRQEEACHSNKWWYLGTAIVGLLVWGIITLAKAG